LRSGEAFLLMVLACGGGALGACDPAAPSGDAGVCADPTASSPPPPCMDGWYEYSDSICSPPIIGPSSQCSSNGDHLCHQPCGVDKDCLDPCFPKCQTITVFHGSDVGSQMNVCGKPFTP
jgi:hypothetical protein